MEKRNCINRWLLVLASLLLIIILILVIPFYDGEKALGQGYYFYDAHEITDIHEVMFSYTEFTNYESCVLNFKDGKYLDYNGMTVTVTRVRFNDDIIIVEGIPYEYYLFKKINKSYYWIIQNDGKNILGPLSQDDFLNLDLTNAGAELSFILEDFTLDRDDFYNKHIIFFNE